MREKIAVDGEEWHETLAHLAPSFDVQTDNAGDIPVVIWHRPIAPPHGHEQQEVSSMLFGAQMRGVGQICVWEHWHGWGGTHVFTNTMSCPKTARNSFAFSLKSFVSTPLTSSVTRFFE